MPDRVVNHKASGTAAAVHRADTANDLSTQSDSQQNDAGTPANANDAKRIIHPTTFIGYRITNPNMHKVNLKPPFGQVLVQTLQPVPGQVYNIMYVAVKNSTKQVFTASNGFVVRFPNKINAKVFPDSYG